MTYIGLANKYRPRLLNEIVGQDFLVKSLSASIEANKVAGAILLSGSYGTGKTTTARAMTLSLVCLNRAGALPCLKCDSCISALSCAHPDILEIDAASNTGVEDIRVLIEGSLYKPLLSKHKAYIIDEVHMLSQSAFNALLKLLEEPPEHVKFFLATTELHKIPATIISRCQHYRLSRLSKPVITERIKQVAEKEKIKITQEALDFIGEKAVGSLRDGISILEQSALQSAQEEITLQFLRSKMGLADLSEMQALFESIIGGNCESAIKNFNELYYKGHEALAIFEDLVALINKKTQELITSKKETKLSFFCRLAKCILSGIEEVKAFNSNHYVAELVIIRMTYMSDLPSPGEIVQIFSKDLALDASTKKHTEALSSTSAQNKSDIFLANNSNTLTSNDPQETLFANTTEQNNHDDVDELTGYILGEFKGSELLD